MCLPVQETQERHRFDPWFGKVLWRRKWQPTPMFLPGKSYEQRSLLGCSAWNRKRVGLNTKHNCPRHSLISAVHWTSVRACCCCWVASVVSDSVRPHRRQPTRLPHPWDSPGKNTGVGCHFFLQCMQVRSESEVAQLCPTFSDPMDCSPPGSSVQGTFQARGLEWGAIAFSTVRA